MYLSETVPASEFKRNFGLYRMLAQREAVPVSSYGRVAGYFVGPDEYEAFKRFQEQRRDPASASSASRRNGDGFGDREVL